MGERTSAFSFAWYAQPPPRQTAGLHRNSLSLETGRKLGPPHSCYLETKAKPNMLRENTAKRSTCYTTTIILGNSHIPALCRLVTLVSFFSPWPFLVPPPIIDPLPRLAQTNRPSIGGVNLVTPAVGRPSFPTRNLDQLTVCFPGRAETSLGRRRLHKNGTSTTIVATSQRHSGSATPEAIRQLASAQDLCFRERHAE